MFDSRIRKIEIELMYIVHECSSKHLEVPLKGKIFYN